MSPGRENVGEQLHFWAVVQLLSGSIYPSMQLKNYMVHVLFLQTSLRGLCRGIVGIEAETTGSEMWANSSGLVGMSRAQAQDCSPSVLLS